jgi:hypothetical protein
VSDQSRVICHLIEALAQDNGATDPRAVAALIWDRYRSQQISDETTLLMIADIRNASRANGSAS